MSTKEAECLGGCGAKIDGMCSGCVEGARILNRNAIGRLRAENEMLRVVVRNTNAVTTKGDCLCGRTTSAPNQHSIWVWPKGHAGYWTQDGCRPTGEQDAEYF